jgi:hypothetical protein
MGKDLAYMDMAVLPSTNLIKNHVPEKFTTVQEIIAHISVWAKEFIQLYKKGRAYKKLHDGSYDFDVAMDMYYSFWVVVPISHQHVKYEMLKEAGICYTCTCPIFQHYYCCKVTHGGSNVPALPPYIRLGRRYS